MKKRLIAIVVLFGIFILIMGMTLTNQITGFDDAIYKGIFQMRNSFFDNFFKAITKFGNGTIIFCFTIILLIYLRKKDRYILGTTIVVTVTINQIIKHIIQRPRPNHMKLIMQGGYSFPSGHAMISIALYGFLIHFVNKKIKTKWLKCVIISLLAILILGIGCSRIYLGVHYPSDVLSGYILSFIVLITIQTSLTKRSK